jgi:ATP-binding cassette subfamily F protein 3
VSTVVLEDLSLSFGKKRIVEALDLRIAEGDRIGLIGPNGSGKSTLMKILAGQIEPDSGAVRRVRGLRVGYLSQDIQLDLERSLLSYVRDSVPGRETIETDIQEAQAALDASIAEGTDEARTLELSARLAELHERLTHFETLYSEHEAQRILAGLGFSTADGTRPLGEFSGGWRMRAALAALLFQQPDLLLLDEPTNHLDMPSVTWFGHFLQRYGRAFVLICHDRDFLNEQINRVVSFEVEGVRTYKGNYEHYRKQRAEEEEVLSNQARNLAREREKAEQFINRFRAQANKAKAVQSRIKALEKMGEVHSFESRRIMRFRFPPCERTGNEVMRVEGLSKSFGDLHLFSGLDLRVARGEKIGIIGVNGAGKTTLLRMMAGEIPADAGELRTGSRVEMGYYAQHHAEALDRGSTIFEEVSRVDGTQSQTRVRNICGAFLFQGDDVDKRISVLSGGERARVALAKLMLKPGNFLLMDEPTNHLDLESSESLAETLSEYDGTLIFVSHNRSFIRTLATKIWNVADGKVEEYPGTLDEYMHSLELRSEETDAAPKSPKPAPSVVSAPSKSEAAPAKPKRSRSEERARKRAEAEARKARAKKLGPLEKEVQTLEARIETLEAEQKERSGELARPEVYEDPSRKSELLDAYSEAAEKLDELTARWEIKSAELEELAAEL